MKALVPIANGSEEMEAVIIIDTLRRAEWDVTVAGLTAGTIEASRGVKWVGSICAAALALSEAGILEGKKFTCYPGVEEKLPANIQPVDEAVVVDGHLITSQGPGTAFEFALKVIAECSSPNKSAEVRAGLLL